jgi:arylsulfotransferase ASST
MDTKVTRRRFLTAMSAGATYLALTNTASCALPKILPAPPKGVWTFRSRPDLSPAAVEVTTTQAYDDTAPEYIFAASKEGTGDHGPMIIDDLGQLVWYGKYGSARDFKMRYYQGRPVLTWWERRVIHGQGIGEYAIFDGSYSEIARVRAGNGYQGDHHEFLISPQDTALLTAYVPTRTDLSTIGGPEYGAVWDGVAQEVDIETGRVLFEWHSLEHVSIEESYFKQPDDPDHLYDYFHINSIDVDHDDNLIISSRNTCTVYKVERNSGEILWRLGGKKSDFEMGPGTQSAWQHDARRHEDGSITAFDNGAHPKVHDQSRGIIIEIDEEKMSATLLQEYTSPEKLLTTSQGNVQLLPNANVFIGWGSAPFISEFSYDGKLLFNAHFPPDCESYRAFRFPWKGHPTDAPVVVAESGSDDEVTLYTSWNGATEVTRWQVLAGPSPEKLRPVGSSVPRGGFETAITVRTAEPYVGVEARDRSDRVLVTSKAVMPRS